MIASLLLADILIASAKHAELLLLQTLEIHELNLEVFSFFLEGFDLSHQKFFILI